MNENIRLKMWAVSCIPDLALAWAYMKLTDDRWSDFWWFLLGMSVVQALFWIKRWAAGSIAFRLYGRQWAVDVIAKDLRASHFPKPDEYENFDSFVERVADDQSQPATVRVKAAALFGAAQAHYSYGFLATLRMSNIYDLAFKNFKVSQ